LKQRLSCFLPVVFLVSLQLTAQIPRSNHVVVILEENHSYASVIGNRNMPYLNSLASKYAIATQYYANTHPSIGNYFELTTGQIITNNDNFTSTVTADNMVRHMLTAAKTWRSYAESLPSVGYVGGDVYPYLRHHNPFSFFSDVRNSSVQKLNVVPFSHFAGDVADARLPQFSFVIPNAHHDAHDCPAGLSTCTDAQKLASADAWLKTNIAPLIASPAFQQDGILIIVFDESSTSDKAHGGGHVAALIVGPRVKKGFKSTTFYQHQNVLHTVLKAIGVSTFPGAAASASPMTGLFLP
jgi:phospholipase C